jgi:hypothetical protein
MLKQSHFVTMDMEGARRELPELLRRTAVKQGRVEVQTPGFEPCVIISKRELESLESALEILSDVGPIRQVEETLGRCVRFMSPERGPDG